MTELLNEDWYCFDFWTSEVRMVKLSNDGIENKIDGDPVIFKANFSEVKTFFKHKINKFGIIFKDFKDLEDWISTSISDFKETQEER